MGTFDFYRSLKEVAPGVFMANAPHVVRSEWLAAAREGSKQFWEKGWYKRVFGDQHGSASKPSGIR